MTSWTPEEQKEALQRQLLETPIAELRLSVRVVNTLEDNNIILVKDLLTQTYETLLQMKNFGEKTLQEVKGALKLLGLPVPAWSKQTQVKKKATPRTTKDEEAIFDLW